MAFGVAGLVYGGLHLLAWDARFASSAENVLWRCSGAVVASTGFVIIGCLLVELIIQLSVDGMDTVKADRL